MAPAGLVRSNNGSVKSETGSGGGSTLLSRQAVRILDPPNAVMSRRQIKAESETQSRLFAINAHREKIMLTLEAGQRDQQNMAQSVRDHINQLGRISNP